VNSWFLLIFLSVPNAQGDLIFFDKMAIPMTGTIEQACKKDSAGIPRYRSKIKTEENKIVIANLCVTREHWQGVRQDPGVAYD
jgi:hypothetical protein